MPMEPKMSLVSVECSSRRGLSMRPYGPLIGVILVLSAIEVVGVFNEPLSASYWGVWRVSKSVWAQPVDVKKRSMLSPSIAPAIILPNIDRPTIQRRFAPRDEAFVLYLGGGGHIRDDYYTSLGYQVNMSYFFTDRWGLELRLTQLWTSLSDEAEALRDRYGLLPDARPQGLGVSIGAQYGLGYGKMLIGSGVTHFDPLIIAHFGVMNAEERYLPSLSLSLSPTILLRYGVRVRLDLGVTMQLESRERGTVFTTGFLPMVHVGWGGTAEELSRRIGGGS
jgi:hypothetical protein